MPVSAHPAPFSYVDLQMTRDGIDAAVVMHAFDVAHDLGLTSEDRVFDADFVQNERREADGDGAVAIVAECERHASRRRAGGRLGRSRPARRPRAPSLQRVEPRGPPDPSCALFPYDPSHQTFLNIYEGETLTPQTILDAGQTSVDVLRRHAPGTLRGDQEIRRRPASITS